MNESDLLLFPEDPPTKNFQILNVKRPTEFAYNDDYEVDVFFLLLINFLLIELCLHETENKNKTVST